MTQIEANGIKLSCRDEGAGEPIVFLHAFPLNHSMWDDQVSALASRYRVVSFDWRGFGQSAPVAVATRMEVLADDLAGLLDALAIERAVICGLSMGGYAAFAFQRKHAARVRALILADTRAGADTEDGKLARYEMAELARQSGPMVIADRLIPKLLAPLTRETKPQIVERVRAMIEGNSGDGIASALLGMAGRADSTPLLSGVNCPTLVLVGGEDALTPPSEAEKMSRLIPGAWLEIIPDAGHLSNLEQPEEFNRAVADFLKNAS